MPGLFPHPSFTFNSPEPKLLEHEFWHQKWQQNHIGFHEPKPHRYLVRHLEHLRSLKQNVVFVPLCGKSLDMPWLVEQGFEVIGVELSELAIRDFFTENGLHPKVEKQGPFTIWSAPNLRLLQGDFFDLTPTDLADCTALYDRAALIALPPELRQQYVSHLSKTLAPGLPSLLISLNYPAHEKAGPPFSVDSKEVMRLFAGQSIEILEQEDVLAAHPHFEKNGMSALTETLYSW